MNFGGKKSRDEAYVNLPEKDNNSGEMLPVPAKGIIGPKEVKELFEVYFDYMNVSSYLPASR